ncbi:periplasmic binding protein [Segniliparus rotundus DSM 44985]|uniref:Periplasmic binding protein n=2 Tax=Segniliparus rotundus TaxID=286802 RepID=D6Z797_SEGRD|nr:periplasmic binding protein [Segniliparus rotundus DSM 44985]
MFVPLLATALLLAGCGEGARPVPGATVSKERTEIGGINLIGVAHIEQGDCAPPVFAVPTPEGLADPDEEPPAPAPPAAPEPSAPPEPQPAAAPAAAQARRILVVGDSLLDGLCALGLGERIVGRVAERAGQAPPNYLGPFITTIPQTGAVGSVAMGQVRDLRPDLVLVSSDLIGELGADLGPIAPVLPVGPRRGPLSPSVWQQQFQALAAVFGREQQAQAILRDYQAFVDEQRQDGTLDPAHTRASLVRFDDRKIAIEGPESFAGSVLADLGVDRPPAQSSGAAQAIGKDQLGEADGDLVYVSFGEPESFGEGVVSSPQWRRLASVREKQVFAVCDQWWYRGAGPIAARNVVIDVVGSLNTPPPP